MGPVHLVAVWEAQATSPPSKDVDEAAETSRLLDALALAQQDLAELRTRYEVPAPEAGWSETLIADLLRAQTLFLEDPMFTDRALAKLRGGASTAEEATERVLEELVGELAASESRYLQVRVADIRSAILGLLRRLRGLPATTALLVPSVVVGTELSPADLLWMDREKVLGLVLEGGDPTDHTSVLSQTLGIPTLVKVSGIRRAVNDGDRLIVDGLSCRAVVHPTPGEQAEADRLQKEFAKLAALPVADSGARTADGSPIRLFASVELPEEGSLVTRYGADGVGLFRSEYLCLLAQEELSEPRQLAAYRELLRLSGAFPVTIRTFDFGGGKQLTSTPGPRSDDSGDELRGLAGALVEGEGLERQFRALLQAAAVAELRVLLPYVEKVEDFERARQLLAQAALALEADGSDRGRVELGAMVEAAGILPACRTLAEQSDFLSVGTTDLAASVLEQRRVDHPFRFQFLDPAVLQALAQVEQAASLANVAVSVCGSMVVEPLALPVLLGLGYRDYCAPCAFIPLLRSTFSLIAAEDARSLLPELLRADTAEEVATLVSEAFSGAFCRLWPRARWQVPTVGA